MNNKMCPVCNNFAPYLLTKYEVHYNQCSSCKTIFSARLDNSDMVGGGNEEGRNEIYNPVRLERIKKIFGDRKIKILDFGCGSGMFVDFMGKEGYSIDGYDLYNPKFESLPKNETYDLVNLCEVVEHTNHPFFEIKAIARYLKKGGFLMTETSFVDVMVEDGINPEDWFYLDPRCGHSTIFSHHGLDLLMAYHGIHPQPHIDRNVRIHKKA